MAQSNALSEFRPIGFVSTSRVEAAEWAAQLMQRYWDSARG